MSTSTQSPSIHGHEIIHLIYSVESSNPFTPAELAAEVARRFGTEARFHTCSPGSMTIEELVAFLLSRGKVVLREGRLYTDFSKVCGHGDDHHEH